LCYVHHVFVFSVDEDDDHSLGIIDVNSMPGKTKSKRADNAQFIIIMKLKIVGVHAHAHPVYFIIRRINMLYTNMS